MSITVLQTITCATSFHDLHGVLMPWHHLFLSGFSSGGYSKVVSVPSDPQLLREFAERRSEAAFAELVRRHIDLVHSTACRLMNDPHLAKDVSQGVFVALAKDAGKLVKHPVLSGWLHRTTRNIAAQSIRTEVRRRHREQEAAAMNNLPDAEPSWEEIFPALDAALAELGESDRDAILLRYFENKPAKDIAAILGIGVEAAQKRVSRAVEKLRDNLSKRGVTAGVAGLGGIISANAVQTAPLGLAASIIPAATAASSLVLMAIFRSAVPKLALGIATTAAVLTAVHQTALTSDLREKNQVLEREMIRLMDSTHDSQVASVTPAGAKHRASGLRPAPPRYAVMASINGPSDPSDYSLFVPGGRGITTGAAEAAGLEPDERKAVDKILRGAWKRMDDDFASRAVEVPPKKAGTREYSVPARSDGGSGPRRQLETALDAEVGSAKREILMRNLKPYDFFAGFGALNVRMVFQKDTCNCSVTDPQSGEQLLGRGMITEIFQDSFGSSFKIPKP